MAPIVSVGDIVVVTSHEPKPFSIMHDSRSYKLEPEKATPVPFDAMALWFGDPRASGAVQSLVDEKGIRAFVADRESEIRRLRIKWGIIGGDETLLAEGTNGARIPDVSVQTLDGDDVSMVVHDPAGENLAVVPSITQHQDLLAIVQRQQQQIAQLVEMVSANTANQVLAPEGEQAPSEVDGQESVAPESTTGLPPSDEGTDNQPPPPPPPVPPSSPFTQGDGGQLS